MTNLDTILKSRDIILPIKIRLGSCLENPRVGGAWWAAIYAVAQSQTRLKRLSSSSRGPVESWYLLPLTELRESV